MYNNKYFKKYDILIEEVGSTSGNVKIPNGTSGKTNISGDTKVQDKLSEWNNKYSQFLKFENNEPKTVPNNINLNGLLKFIIKDNQFQENVSTGLTKIAEYLNNPYFNGKKIDIFGFTSSKGGTDYNQKLSERRADIISKVLTTLLKDSGVKITFNPIGKGENDKIVGNDGGDTGKDEKELTQAPLINPKYKLNPQDIESMKGSLEKRQQINRRVEIHIEGIPIPIMSPIVATIAEPVKKVEEIVKPLPPELLDTFNYDSYILSENGEKTLTQYCTKLVEYLKTNKTDIKDIYISSHTMRGKEKENKQQSKDEKIRDKKLFIISCNRAYLVQNFIKSKLGKDYGLKIKFHLFPVAWTMGEEKKVVLTYDETTEMNTAKESFTNLNNTYKISSNDYGLNINNYITNNVLRDAITKNIETMVNNGNEAIKYIPLELYYNKGEINKFDIGKEVDLDKFKQKIIDIIKNSNNRDAYTIKDFVYNIL